MSARSPVIIDLKFSGSNVAECLEQAFKGRKTINMAEEANKGRDLSEAAYAVVWRPDQDLFRRAGNLKVIFSGGAGVDHILSASQLPDLPIVRFVDRSLTDRMSEWVVLQCLLHLRQMPTYGSQQQARSWHEIPLQPEARDITVGVMGLGVLGRDAARKLKTMGFNVIGWSRHKKQIEGIKTYDSAALDAFLTEVDMLVGLLPLTDETRGIYNADLFGKLRQGGALGRPIFMNAGRGGSQVENDIVDALRSGTLGGASLDVFENEPLAADSPLWTMANVIITPHAAASSDVRALFGHVEQQIARYERGEPLEYVVNRDAGY